ncbi:redoxin domain-containing protein [Jiangella alkaliphila]|uniref:AhpC/TSA family protein n=1 Tax=Jiangella alkaliphila TaxID=419479 RepID=A0A1H2L7X6_9ACTN|nr:redoxin domain-containing protein [Jiangella alkaliphila]SDU76668.1 AhpC/TSA family protein [Jiangella alkaliphila]
MRPRSTALVGAVLLCLSACGSVDNGDELNASPPTASATTDPIPAATPEPTTPAPPAQTSPAAPAVALPEELDFTAPTVAGGTFEGASLLGRPAVLWFWAPWCPVCQREAPLIADLAGQYEGQVAFVGVAGLSGDLASMEDFIADGGVDAIPHIDDRDGDVYTRFEVTQQYDFGLVSADGTVEVIRGPLGEDEIVAAVERLAAG